MRFNRGLTNVHHVGASVFVRCGKDGATAVVQGFLIKDFDPESVHDLAKNKKIYWRSDDASADVRDEGFYDGSLEELNGELKCMTAHHSWLNGRLRLISRQFTENLTGLRLAE